MSQPPTQPQPDDHPQPAPFDDPQPVPTDDPRPAPDEPLHDPSVSPEQDGPDEIVFDRDEIVS
jgi:hypothetical protein